MNWFETDEGDLAEYNEWLAERPPAIRTIAERINPWTMYRLRTTGQRCRLLSFFEDGTVRVYAEHETLGPITGVQVYGIDPDDLVPWDGKPRPDWVVETSEDGMTISVSVSECPP